MSALRIHLFGGLLLEREGNPLPPIASRAGRSLFANLVMRAGRPSQRDYLAGSFWPDLPEGKARRRLSQTLWQIQDVVNDGALSHLTVTSDTLAFDTSEPYWLDVHEFDRCFESAVGQRSGSSSGQFDSALLSNCVELYRGDFLEGFFDDWALIEQDHYRQRYLVALRRLVDASKADGAYEEALAHARRLTHHNPLSEEIHQEVMRLSFLLGRTSEAVEQFERCRAVLAEELDAEPSPATIELYEKITRRRSSGVSRQPDSERGPILEGRPDAPFVGRDQERGDLVESMERVLAGSGGVVLVEGEPGVGKTRLALEAADDARWRGFHVSWGRCTKGALRPFDPLVEILESLSDLGVEQLADLVSPVWLNEALRVAPSLRDRNLTGRPSTGLRPAEESARMTEALTQTLVGLGEISPRLIVVDDVQWADRDTLAVLDQLGQRLSQSRILLLVLYRSEEARGDPETWDVLRALDHIAGLRRVVLSSLSVFELDDLVRRVLGVTRLDGSVSAQLHRRTGGNTLFALESLLVLRDHGLFDAGDPGEALRSQLDQHEMPVAPRVRSVILDRVSLLTETDRTVYEAAVVISDTADLSLLSLVTGLQRAAVVNAVYQLVRRGLIRREGESQYQVAHDQIRQVVYDSIPLKRRALLHQDVAQALREMDANDVAAIGHHFNLAGEAAEAASFLSKAGERAIEVSAYATARQHLEVARKESASAGWAATDRFSLLGQMEAVLDVLGRRQDQQDVLEEMSTLLDSKPELSGDLERRWAWLKAHTGDFSGAEDSGRRSIDVEAGRGNKSGLAASLIALGTILRWSGRPLDAIPHLEKAVATADGYQERQAAAMTELASTLVEVQRFVEAHPQLQDASGLYGGMEDWRGLAEVAGIQARALHLEGDWVGARDGFERAIDLCRRVGYRHGEGVNLVNLSVLHHTRGSAADALMGYELAKRIFAELGNVRGEAMVLANAAAARHDLIGDDVRALADAKTALQRFKDIGDRAREAQCLEIIAGVAARGGRRDEAKRLLEKSLADLADAGNRFLQAQHLRSLALLQIEGGEHRDALATVRIAEEICREVGLEDLGVELLSVEGMALLGLGQVSEAAEATGQAVEGMTPGVERPYLVFHRHSIAALAAGNQAEARDAALRARKVLDAVVSGLDDEDRRRALSDVPEHVRIMAEAHSLTPHKMHIHLPSSQAPTGRPLESHELRPVEWTVHDPEDDAVASVVERRRLRLLRLIDEADASGARASIEQLARALGVSDSTIRRDLTALRERGYSVATRGRGHRAS